MAANNKIITLAVLFLLVVLRFGVAVDGYKVCQIETDALRACETAVTPPEHGQPLPLPSDACCGVVRSADLKCLCRLKSALPAMGINTANAMALPAKCGVSSVPSECHP